MALSVDVRCPVGPKRLFMRLVQSGGRPVITPGNLMEFACHDCKRQLRLEGQEVANVLHRYDLAGALVETEVVRPATEAGPSLSR